MAQWDLASIRQKVRQVTGRYSPQELSNEQLDNYINQFFQFTFPAEVKLDRFHTYYELLTTPNQPTYTQPASYINFEAPATMDNFEIAWYQDPTTFYTQNPEQINRATIGVGDGVTLVFSGTAGSFPIMPASTVVTDNVETFQDTNATYGTANVNLVSTGAGNGTINYSTGAVSVAFAVAPANGTNIVFSYTQFSPTRPQAVLLFNNQFTFYPVPDTAYRFKCKAYVNTLVTTAAGATTTDFTNATDRPLLDQWGPCIAYGASRSIQADYGEMDAYKETTALYKEQVQYVITRTEQNALNTRARPNF